MICEIVEGKITREDVTNAMNQHMNNIDTSTTEGKIEVMKAAARGEDIEWCNKKGKPSIDVIWTLVTGPTWNWNDYDYRIRPKPPERQPLGPADFPPGVVIKLYKGHGYSWSAVVRIDAANIHTAERSFSFEDLMDLAERSLDGGKTWLPCYK